MTHSTERPMKKLIALCSALFAASVFANSNVEQPMADPNSTMQQAVPTDPTAPQPLPSDQTTVTAPAAPTTAAPAPSTTNPNNVVNDPATTTTPNGTIDGSALPDSSTSNNQ